MKKLKPIDADLKGIYELEDLFCEWQRVQRLYGAEEQENADDIRTSTFPDRGKAGVKGAGFHGDFYTSFCRDGFLKGPVKGKKTVLFICREAHLDLDGENKLPPEQGRFWMRKHYLDWVDGRCPGDKYTSFLEETSKPYGKLEELNLAYMNLNKRGGFGDCNKTRIKHYTERYQAFIRREVEIIAPDFIICGGTFGTINAIKDFLPGLAKTLGKEIKCRDFYHPKAPGGIYKKKEEDNSVIQYPSGEQERLNQNRGGA